jgi:hypothetical protein
VAARIVRGREEDGVKRSTVIGSGLPGIWVWLERWTPGRTKMRGCRGGRMRRDASYERRNRGGGEGLFYF